MLPLLYQAWKKNQKPGSPALRKLQGAVRVGIWLSAVSLGIGFVATHSANAEVKTASMAFGREMTTLVGEAESTHVKLNGQSIHLSQTTSNDSIHQVVESYEKFCKENPSAFGEMWSKLPIGQKHEGKELKPLPEGMTSGVLKEEGKNEAMVICFTKGAKSASTFEQAMSRFNETMDLGEIGRLRYVYVKNVKPQGTKVVAAWTDDSFKFGELGLEGNGEAPGTDTALPKPEGARRVLNAEVVGTPYGVRIYQIKQSADEVAGFYDKWAKESEFHALAPELDQKTRVRAYFNGGAQVMIGVFENDDGKRYLTLSELLPQNGHAVEMSREP